MFEMVTKIDCSSYEAKFLIFARVIDMFARHSVLSSVSNTNDLTLTFNELKERLLADKDVKVILGTFSDKQINEWISELSWMGYIERVSERTNNSVIKLTPEGFAAYKSQNLQSIAANLLAARESRRQSNIAIWIAVISIVVTAIFSILGFCINKG
jgi:hypothetical protein